MRKILLSLILCSNVYAMDYRCNDEVYTATVRDNQSIVVEGTVNGISLEFKVENAGYRRFFSEEFYGSTVGDVQVDYIKLEVTALLTGTLSLRNGAITETRSIRCEKL